MKRISIIGLGKLGGSMAAAYASRGYEVLGVDINNDYVDKFNKGEAPFDETNLQEYLDNNKNRIVATTDFLKAVMESDISFVIVPTPSLNDHSFSVEYAIKAFAELGQALVNKNEYHLFVLTSTVLPNDCESKIIPEIEKNSGKKCGVDFGFCYSPEFIAIGSVIHNLLNPDFFLVGEFDKKSGDILSEFYNNISENHSSIKRMNIVSAELAKITLNHFVITKITFANMLAEVAEKISGVDIDDVVDAIGTDERIGKKYLKPGLGFGGPCFPRDSRAFAKMSLDRGVEVPFASVTDSYNLKVKNRVVELCKKYVTNDSVLTVFGLAYKPNTYFCEESQSIMIANDLVDFCKVKAYEPFGNYHAACLLNKNVAIAENFDSCFEGSNTILVANIVNNNLLLKIIDKIKNIGNDIVLIDVWRQFKDIDLPKNVSLVLFGKFR